MEYEQHVGEVDEITKPTPDEFVNSFLSDGFLEEGDQDFFDDMTGAIFPTNEMHSIESFNTLFQFCCNIQHVELLINMGTMCLGYKKAKSIALQWLTRLISKAKDGERFTSLRLDVAATSCGVPRALELVKAANISLLDLDISHAQHFPPKKRSGTPIPRH